MIKFKIKYQQRTELGSRKFLIELSDCSVETIGEGKILY